MPWPFFDGASKLDFCAKVNLFHKSENDQGKNGKNLCSAYFTLFRDRIELLAWTIGPKASTPHANHEILSLKISDFSGKNLSPDPFSRAYGHFRQKSNLIRLFAGILKDFQNF